MDNELKKELIDNFTESAKETYDKIYDQKDTQSKGVIWIIGVLIAIVLLISKINATNPLELVNALIGLLIIIVILGFLFQVLIVIYKNRNMVMKEIYSIQQITLKSDLKKLNVEDLDKLYKQIKLFEFVKNSKDAKYWIKKETQYRVICDIILHLISIFVFSFIWILLKM